MTLGDLLTLLRESILNDRTDRTGGSSDYLWTDATLVSFINEAQRKFAVESFILRDGTSDAATLIPLVAGQTIYDLHPSILSVMSAQTVGRTAALTRVGHSLFTAYRTPSESWVDPQSFDTLQPGETLAFSTDEALNDASSGSFSQVTMRIWPAPSAAMVTANAAIRLRVVRRPINALAVSSLSAIPEIPEDHHIEMLDWAAHLALRIVDDDAGAPKRATDFAASFDVSVTKARKLAMRKMFAPQGWGFGRGGFTWER